ncbi:MAG: folylpolyglutamate synthase/dihydrofolate synthase family protein [Hyphomicrobiaceae bacterium]
MTGIVEILARLKRLHPLSIDLSLDRIERLLADLGHPEQHLPPVFHIAGTNGKGSVTAYLKAILQASGRAVHVYTSPHLVRFNERIEIAHPDGARPIDETRLGDLLERVERINDGRPITFFEITTAAALLAFAESPADAVILEVGLGGRLDTTNVVARPAVTAITSISMDHAERLGGTLEAIAFEKAGILKRGTPAVIARQPDEVERVIEARAARVGAPLIRQGQEFDAYRQNGRLVFQGEDRLLDLPLPALIGRHQIANAGVAIAAALAAPALSIDEKAIASGLTSARWPARMQRLTTGFLVDLVGPDAELWLDGGHNPAAGMALAETLADLDERSSCPVWLIVGMMGQKDAAGYLAAFRNLVVEILTVPIPGSHEAPYPPERLAEIARDLGFRAEASATVEAALRRIRSLRKGPGRVLICGSLYLAGHVLALQEGVTVQTN